MNGIQKRGDADALRERGIHFSPLLPILICNTHPMAKLVKIH